jgi:hypothetical protein
MHLYHDDDYQQQGSYGKSSEDLASVVVQHFFAMSANKPHG